MPSKLTFHLSGYPEKTFDVLARIQPSVVKVFNQSSEMNIDAIRTRCPGTIIVYRHYTNLGYRDSADAFFAELGNTFQKLSGRGILWEGLNEPVVQSVEDAQALNAWYVRFAEILHAYGEQAVGFSWSTGNPTPDKLPLIIPYLVDAAAATDVHAFHEYYSTWGGDKDWCYYRVFEEMLPPHARKPVVITEAGYDDTGDPMTGGWRGKVSAREYIEILKAYDARLMQDPYVLGATIFQWGDTGWFSFDLTEVVEGLADYIVSVGGGAYIPRPFPVPAFGPKQTFAATPRVIKKGQQTTLQWEIEGAQSVTLEGQPVEFSGSYVIAPAETTTYVLGLVLADGSTKELRETVYVEATTLPVLVTATLTPTTLQTGELLNVTFTIQNNSSETLTPQAPAPGTVYEEGETFYTRGFPDVPDTCRVGVDFAGRTGIDHPYRWGLGAPLAPGERTTITGAIRLNRVQATDYWAGLVQEGVQWLQDEEGKQKVTVTPAPIRPPAIVSVTFTPTTPHTGELLNVSIVVRNNSNETLPTQGPPPGYVYQEGENFDTTSHWSQAGAFRVGVDFAGRTGIDHPYRWGLGAPLAPGESVTITGAIRLTTAHSAEYWAGLVQEYVAWVQDDVGRQNITVTYPPTSYAFSISPETLVAGASAVLQWNVVGARTVYLDGEEVAASGTRRVTPTRTTTYTLRIVWLDGGIKELTTMATVTNPDGGPTRPPTVVLTAENLARLRTFPRPARDNGRGLHFDLDLRDSTIQRTIEHLTSINARWTMIYAQDELQARRAAQACWNAGIMPIVRIGKRVDESFDPVVYVNALKEMGAPPYVQIYNEPGDIREWKTWPGDNWAQIFAGRWASAAARVVDAGGYPGLQILDKGELDAVVAEVRAIGRTDIWERAFFALHNYGANHPPAYPYDPRNQQDSPGETILDDEVSVLAFLAYAKWMQERIGFVLPMIGGEGGWEFGSHEDQRYPKCEQPYHAQYHAEMFDWFRTGILSNGEPLPDYLFSITPWIVSGWGADDWWGGPLGDKTETINAVKAIPEFERKFSWDGVPLPPLQWDARLDALGVKLTRSDAVQAWRLIAAEYQDETQSSGTHHIYVRAQNNDGTPAAGVRFVVDWNGRTPDTPSSTLTTDANGEANFPMFAILHPELQDGPYFTFARDAASDAVSGMGLPVNRHVNFILTFRWSAGAPLPPPTYTFTAIPDTIQPGESSALQWNVTHARTVTLDGQAVPSQGTKVVSPLRTTTYALHIVFDDGSVTDATVTITVPTTPSELEWDARLDALGVKLKRSDAAEAWRLVSAKYQDETESGGKHHVFFKALNADGTPKAGLDFVVDWVGRDPGDQPAVVTTDANGETNCPLWAILHPDLQDGPYFTLAKDQPSDTVSGMGLPMNRHVCFLLTFQLKGGAPPPPPPPPPPTASFAANPTTIQAGQSATLQWSATRARSVTLDSQAVAATGSRVVTPAQTTTYALHVLFDDGSAQDLEATVTVTAAPPPPPEVEWDARLDALGVKLTRTDATPAWKLIVAQYQSPDESGGKHHVFFKAQNADGSPRAGVKFVIDWVGRDPADAPAYATTDWTGEASCPLWAAMDPAQQNGIYFVFVQDAPSDRVGGLGLPNGRYVNFLLTFRYR